MKIKRISIDKHGNSTSFYSNGLVSFKVRCDLITFGYSIIELKTGLPVMTKESMPTRLTMLVNIKRDLYRLFELNQSTVNIYSERLSFKKRRLT